MTRIVAGSLKGRVVKVPAAGTRPTSDRVREAMFSSLESRLGGDWHSEVFLDVYAGSGAVGLEAASRGARAVTFVESARAALAVLRANIAGLRLAALGVDAQVVGDRAEAVGVNPHGAATIAFFDPPYELDSDALETVISRFVSNGWVSPDTLVVVERSARGDRNLLDAAAERKTYGETALWYGRVSQPGGHT